MNKKGRRFSIEEIRNVFQEIEAIEEKIMLVNITWNPYGWRNIYTNPKAGHQYASLYPGHESLNFKFNKKNVDNDKKIYGYVQWTTAPVFFSNDGLIIFFTKNIETGLGNIVGLYGKSRIINKQYTKYDGFKDNKYVYNIEAEKNYSILFPVALNAEKYKENGKRLVPQVGFTYKSNDFAKKIILDEITELTKNGILENEFIKLKYIYEYYFGELNKFDFNIDELEQNELINLYKLKSNEQLLNELLNDTGNTDQIIVNKKEYKRNNSNIAKIKILREFKCQICGKTIIKKDGSKYVEAAHIKPKSKGGKELWNNIILLCPNHHKEFDLGKSEVVLHNENNIKLRINNLEYLIYF